MFGRFTRVLKFILFIIIYLVTQGPSLYSYNDAYFRKDDWTGIRMFGKSLKEKDPLKVGRFGLGFKSTFHLTGESKAIF